MSKKAAVFVDGESIEREGQSATFRIWVIYRAKSRSRADNAKVLRRADCTDYSFTELERVFLNAGTVLQISREPSAERTRAGSLNDGTNRYACDGDLRAKPAFEDPYAAGRAEGFWGDRARKDVSAR